MTLLVALLAVPAIALAGVAGYLTGRIRLAAAVAVAVLLGLGALAWLRLGEHEQWERAAIVSDTQLKVTYSGGDCEDQRTVDVDEDDDSVTITITTRSYASGCSDVGFERSVTVNLDEPLGERKLFDGGCSPRCARTIKANG